MMATVRHVTSSLGLRKFQTDGFLFVRVYSHDSSPVMTLDRKLGSCLTAFCSSVRTWTQWSRWSLFKRRTNFAAVRLMFSSSTRMRTWPVWQSNAITNIMDSLSSRITSRASAVISGVVHVDGRPECLQPSTVSQPSLKHLNHSVILLGLKLAQQRPPLALGGFQLQNLINILCSLTAILILTDTHENCVKKAAKTRKHVHL